jgi:hypothetical protein
MPLLSACIPLYKSTDFAFLKNQNLADTEIILAGPQSLRDKVKDFLPSDSSVVELDNTLQTVNENDIMERVSGEYAVFLNPFESWNERFLTDIRSELKSLKTTQSVVYGLGFVQTPEKTVFAAEFLSHLRKPNSVKANFFQPRFFTPANKYIWHMPLVRDFGLRVDGELKNWQLRQALFNLDYLAAAFENAGFVDPRFHSFPLGFLTKAKPGVSAEDLNVYQEKVQAKNDLWRKNPWHAVYWLSQMQSIIGRPTLTPEKTL